MNKKLVKNGLLTTLGLVSATIPLATTVSCGKAVIKNAERYLKNGALVEAVDEFAKIDEVMNNFIKSGEDQIAWMQKVGDSVIEALNAPIKWSANMMNYLRTLMHENQPIVFLVI